MASLAWATLRHVSHGIADYVSRLAIVRYKVAILALQGSCCPVSAFSLLDIIFFQIYYFHGIIL